MKKWTICNVTYFSSPYIEYQLKILYEFNDPSEFDLIYVDNSCDDSEIEELRKIIKPYRDKYRNVKLIPYRPKSQYSSGQHGEALDIGMEYVDSQYLLVHDPDFFWLKKDYLKWLEYLLQYNDCIGAPYVLKVQEGNEYFPSAFGCAYKVEQIKNVSFMPFVDGGYKESWDLYHEKNTNHDCDFFYDVGWKIRRHLSSSHNDYNFISFSQENIFDLLKESIPSLNNQGYSFESNARIYFHNKTIVASHLFRGNFTGKVKDNKDPKNKMNVKLKNIRKDIAEFMYNSVLNKNDINKILNISYDRKVVFKDYFYKLKFTRLIILFFRYLGKKILKKFRKLFY